MTVGTSSADNSSRVCGIRSMWFPAVALIAPDEVQDARMVVMRGPPRICLSPPARRPEGVLDEPER